MNNSDNESTCMDDFDPDSLAMHQARDLIIKQITTLGSSPNGLQSSSPHRLSHRSPHGSAGDSDSGGDSEILPISACFGRVLSDDILAGIDVPGFRNSAMDGYAFRYDDAVNLSSLDIAGTSLAGHPYSNDIKPGQCIKVMTGAVVPDVFDTVVMQEHVQTQKNQLKIHTLPQPGSNIRNSGSNIGKQETVLAKHTRLGAVELGLLGSLGHHQIRVLRKLKIAYFSTGDELADANMKLGQGMIYDSNRYMLLGLLQQPAIEAIDLGICKDREADLKAVMERCAEADFAISSGGVSVGEADFIKQIVSDTGTIKLWKIAMKPGRPLTHAVLRSGTQFFGLPGNPVSGIVTFHQFVQPAIEAMLGQSRRQEIQQPARLVSAVRKQPGRVELQRGVLFQRDNGEWWVESTGLQDSHVLTSMHRANCFILLALESSGVEANELVLTLPFCNYWHPA